MLCDEWAADAVKLGWYRGLSIQSVPVMFAGTGFFVPEEFASVEATKGLSDRPLETFGRLLLKSDGGWKRIG